MGLTVLSVIFWSGVLLLLFTYGGYALLILPFIKNRATPVMINYPEVTFIVAAYNEVDYIEDKIRNCLALQYPGKVRFIIVTDGSGDGTPERARAFPEVEVMHLPGRAGKTAALNRAMAGVTSPVTVFSDANTTLNPDALLLMVRHYADPLTGGVSGEKKVFSPEKDGAAGAGEGIYWKYESKLKKIDSAFYSLTGAPGELISFRTMLYHPLSQDVILDDFMLSMEICLAGYRMVYEPGAVAAESASADVKEELKRKIRICAGGFQAISRLSGRVSFLKMPRLAYVFYAHRVFRWAVAPWCLIAVLPANFLLIHKNFLYFFLFLLQAFFYFQVGLGWLFKDKNIRLKGFFVPYYFFLMNYAALAGLYKYSLGLQSSAWERSKRATR